MIAIVAVTSVQALAKQDEKKKYVEKSFDVDQETRLNISNKFGEIEINSWAKNKFEVKVEIIGRGRNEDRAQRILDDVKIDITTTSGEIIFETDIPNMKSNNNEGFEINYVVFMPESNPLEIENKFGDVSMGDRSNGLKLDVSYGSFKAGRLAGDVDIEVSFGSGSVTSLEEGDVVVKYSKLDIDQAGRLDLRQGFSTIEIGEIRDLDLESKYGKVEIEKAETIDADAQFTTFQIEELTGSLELDGSYLSNFRIDKLAKSFSTIEIDGKFGSYTIGLEDGLKANINAEFSFADLRYDSDLAVDFHYQVKESNRKTYKGKIGGGHDTKEIRIDSGYGNLRLTRE